MKTAVFQSESCLYYISAHIYISAQYFHHERYYYTIGRIAATVWYCAYPSS
jgi:hypothetical protein